jgi:2-polyprenyl-6-methoxyphenol hydroxylase-like FAD-dependent oxidoreductase
VTGFLRFLKASGRIAFDVPPLHGHAYLLIGTSTRPITAEGVLLVGDAAGLAHPQSGEGIRPAVESGLLAAKIVAQAQGRYGLPKLDGYGTAISARRRQGSGSIGDFLPPGWISFLARHLLKRRWFVRGVVLNRWFLPVQPPWT